MAHRPAAKSPSDGPDVLTGREVAVMLRLEGNRDPEASVARLRRTGQIRGRKVGRQYLYAREEIIRFLREG